MKPLDLLVIFTVAVLAAVIAWRLRGWVRVVAMRRRFARGRQGEEQAEALLRRHGFEILEDQLVRQTGLWVDDQWRDVTVRADFLVRRGPQTYVVEVKTGRSATNPASTATRRQLFEYSHVYDTDGLILADMDHGRLHTIRFDHPHGPLRANTRPPRGWALLGVGLVCGTLLGLWIAGRLLAS